LSQLHSCGTHIIEALFDLSLLPLANTVLSSSGDYERYVGQGDKLFYYMLLPKIDSSAYEVQSVSIIVQRDTFNVALFTVVFVLGV
jgi:thiamine biosynthesis lipoprotein